MNATTAAYNKKVWDFLEKIKPGKTYSVAKLAKPENRKQFIAAVKLYMDTWPWQGHISFNHDYSKFYKMHPVE